MGVLLRIIAIDPVDARRLEQNIGLELQRTLRRRGVGRDKRAAGASGQNHDPPFFQMSTSATPNVRFRYAIHTDRGQQSGLGADQLQRVLQGQSIHHRG